MRVATIDGHTVASMADLHVSLAQQLNFPDWYGGNLDALHDCLCDLHEETMLTLVHGESLAETLGAGYLRLCRVLSDSAEENPYLILQF